MPKDKPQKGTWIMTNNDIIEITFDVLKHVMALSKDIKNLIFISPMRNPPTSTSFSANFKIPKLTVEPDVN